MLRQPRPSSSSRFSNEDLRQFQEANFLAVKERDVVSSVLPFIHGGDVMTSKRFVRDIPFTNLNYLTDGTLRSGKPDLWYGASAEQFNSQIYDKLDGSIAPST